MNSFLPSFPCEAAAGLLPVVAVLLFAAAAVAIAAIEWAFIREGRS